MLCRNSRNKVRHLPLDLCKEVSSISEAALIQPALRIEKGAYITEIVVL